MLLGMARPFAGFATFFAVTTDIQPGRALRELVGQTVSSLVNGTRNVLDFTKDVALEGR